MPIPKSTQTDSTVNRFIKNGLIYAELNEYFTKEFYADGYAGCEIFHNSIPMRIYLKVSKPTAEVIGTNKCRIKQVRSLIAKRLGMADNDVDILVEMIKKKGLCPFTQAVNIAQRLLVNASVRRAVYSSIRAAKEEGAQGIEVIVSGKTKGQRARSTKFIDGLMIHSGQPAKDYVKTGFTAVEMRQGVIGIKVKIMLPYDPEGIIGPNKVMADKVIVFEPKDSEVATF
ncbi:ribosomal protein S3 [Edhazardia aedis USNM 41457]|uniref:40S ribosomal protein S3 n=1 Tax=Edhazardia aedis (strain USNM 41457) TaxID=1003232 RepID=J9D2S1_EDHAE|nr:ribosomal protein S3 [Edhazardia aedis USNM 41457]|eukprot:EJW01879.1 ribosomal protein S3 [Edhazardia aedis USNM 41457]